VENLSDGVSKVAKSNLSSHITFWSAVVATFPWYNAVILWGLGLLKNPEGPGQAAIIWAFIMTPIVVIAGVRSLIQMARGRWTRTDRLLTITGAALYFSPWVLALLIEL
jgi:hypothetical protein